MAKQTLKINSADNVAVAVSAILAGEQHEGVTLTENVPAGHKFALTDIAAGELIIKFGCPIAKATADIPAGSHVHVHNAATCISLSYSFTPSENTDEGNGETRKDETAEELTESENSEAQADQLTPDETISEEAAPQETPPQATTPEQPTKRTVKVYHRENGDVGIRNELWIISTTGSVNGLAKLILKTFKNRFGTQGFDGAYAITHPYGESQCGEDRERTRAILQKLVRHPNAGGVLLVGLDGVDEFRLNLGGVDGNRVKFLNCLEVTDEIESGVMLARQISEVMKRDVREEADISCLKIGLKCGGTDLLSSITANPLLGKFSDYLISNGGTCALSEIPETFGAEKLILDRAENSEAFDEASKLIGDYKDYFRSYGRSVYSNPSPSLSEQGFTTIEEKSVAGTQKGGSSPISGVVFDDGIIEKNGLNLVSGPDDDLCGITFLAAAGCHIVLFVTGKGTPVGGVVPTVKISSNTALFEKKSNWVDFDAGAVLESDYETRLEKLIDFVIAVADGKLTKNEINSTRELAILKTGITL